MHTADILLSGVQPYLVPASVVVHVYCDGHPRALPVTKAQPWPRPHDSWPGDGAGGGTYVADESVVDKKLRN
jgi:hypothetical protein